MITAQGRTDPNQNTGISLQNCTRFQQDREAKFHNFFGNVETEEHIEYLNFGPGSDTRHRVKWGGYKKNCSEEIARQFTVGLFLHGAGHWLKTTGIPLSYGS
ncbi:hypothetical protein L3X38_038944 [Prunus dulcis]|uniref:Pectinesterase catalytic domain-containing protein n=1 Tax=Prunus dulcis TaxID=3755 RepID=A0AAD4YRZ1_PRUDU|nr:hypothetical protein L3X38_038944 [Prunus dulcis]